MTIDSGNFFMTKLSKYRSCSTNTIKIMVGLNLNKLAKIWGVKLMVRSTVKQLLVGNFWLLDGTGELHVVFHPHLLQATGRASTTIYD